MSASRVYKTPVFLGDDPAEVEVRHWSSEQGPAAVLDIGAAVQFHVSTASPELLRRLADEFAALAEWRETVLAARTGVAA